LHAEFAEHGGGATEVGGAQGGAAKTGETATPSRYDVLAMSLLPRLRRALPPNARAAVQVLLDVPKLMSEWLSKLIELEGEEMWRPGLAAYRELATQRDALGPACLRALLQVATSAGESVGEAERRAHAVKIVTAQLLPLPRFASLIGGFAEAQLRRLVGASTAAHPTASCVGDGMDVSSDGELAEDSWAIKSHQEGEENEDILTAHVQLYLAVVAKEPARLWPLLAHFGGASAGAQAVLVRNAPLLVPHIDPVELASLLVRAMREIRPLDPSAPLILALLTAVAAGSPTGTPPAPPAPPAALVEGTLELCCTELRDGRYAVPLLPFAPRPLVESVLPRLLGMAPETASAALAALMHAKPPPLPPAHLLLLLHQLPSDGSAGVSLKQLIDGVQACLAEKSVFTMQVVADALQLIVHLDPLPLIFMRTTIQALLYHPLLAQFTMGLLHHLISRQIWTSPRLWTGFVKCCQQGMPHSLPVMLALPAPQLLEIIEQQPELRPMLISYGAMHLSEVDDDVKEALGLTEEEEVLDI
jgi:symplekin